MATRSTTKPLSTKHVETLTHDEAKRKNIPSAEQQSFVQQDQSAPKQIRYPRNTDLDPQLVWRGKVQCIYFDPPYGIKFNSNFQWSTTSRDVKDGKADHITREPEQVKAFRDTWRDGIHSYLTYLRDRLTVARDLLTESGSIFVQIGDENFFNYEAHATEFSKLGRIPVLKARMNADLHMAEDLKNTGKVNEVDVFKPQTGEVVSHGADGIACWFIDTDYNEESFFVRHAYFLGANDPYSALKTTLKAEIDRQAWDTLNSNTSRPFDKPKSGRVAVKVINHLGDEVMKVFKVV